MLPMILVFCTHSRMNGRIDTVKTVKEYNTPAYQPPRPSRKKVTTVKRSTHAGKAPLPPKERTL